MAHEHPSASLASMPLAPLTSRARIGLVAPSSPFEAEKMEQACAVLEREGFEPVPGRNLWNRKGYVAGAAMERSQDIIDAILSPDIAALFCVRGGYGSGQLLPWLPFDSLRRRPKIFLGYSDITFLHLAFWKRMGWITFHGPNLIEAGSHPGRLRETLLALHGESPFAWDLADDQILRHGASKGVLVGGNLTCLAHLIGTPFFPDVTNVLLLVEDCSETLYRLDRLFTHLQLSGLLERIGGLILGQFENCGRSADILDLIMELVAPYSFPVVANLPFGHGSENEVIPLGASFSLDTHEKRLQALQNPFAR